MKCYVIPDGIISIADTLVECPHCTKTMDFEDYEGNWDKSDGYIRKKCKGCKRFFGITTQINGDFVAYDLKPAPLTK